MKTKHFGYTHYTNGRWLVFDLDSGFLISWGDKDQKIPPSFLEHGVEHEMVPKVKDVKQTELEAA